jgi:uncharacterized protein YndB with AHSA1/START domain
MAVVECRIAASPHAVFEVLANGWYYSNWVVGTSHMRAVDAAWPAPGSKLFHASGVWPLVVRDETVVESTQPDRQLVLTAKAWPTGEARIEIDLTAEGDGTLVRLAETPSAGPGKWLHNPAAEAVLRRRNVESLARLTAIVERHVKPAG